MDFIVFSFGFLSLIGISYSIYNISNRLPYLYVTTKIAAKEANVLSEDRLNSALEKNSLADLVYYLNSLGYKVEGDDLLSFHLSLEKYFLDYSKEIRDSSPKQVQDILDSYFKFYEIKIIKFFYRSRFLGTDINKKLLFSFGSLNEAFLDKLQSTKTVKDIAVVFGLTDYAEVFKKDYITIEDFEIAIDSFVADDFYNKLEKSTIPNKREILDLMERKIDIINILSSIKFLLRDVPKEKRYNLLIKNKSYFSSRLKSICDISSLKDLVNVCDGSDYEIPIKKAYEKYEQTQNIFYFEKELYCFLKREIDKKDLLYFQSPYRIFSKIIKNEFDLMNLIAISKAIDSKLPKEKAKELLIC
ncbi:MAG: V-type ATPase subunit [Candidatus Diapherotrites archaeon]|nr:V-type ATPase subunit [Candidatus Diapherotrites archaeon]